MRKCKWESMKKQRLYDLTKTIWQIFLYCIEIFIIAGGLTWLSCYLYEVSSKFEIIERFMLFYGVYQLFIFIIFNNINDMERDRCIAWEKLLKLCLEYQKTKDEKLYNDIMYNINYQLKSDTANNKEYRCAYENLKDNLKIMKESQLCLELINAEHIEKLRSLQWRFSIILRLVK